MDGDFKTIRTAKFDLEGKLINQWKEDAYCDACFRVAGDVVKAHRCVLAAASEYFDVMFTANFKEKNQPIIDLSDSFQRAEELRTVFEFIYGSEIVIDENNVEGLLQGGEIFDLPELLENCVKFMLRNLKLPNCLWSWSLAETYSLEELADVCQTIAIRRFHDSLRNMPESLKIPPPHLLKLMKHGLMKYCTTEEASAFVDLYISHNSVKHKSYQQELDMLKAAALKGSGSSAKSPQSSLHPATNAPQDKDPKGKETPTIQEVNDQKPLDTDWLGAKPKNVSVAPRMEDCVLVTTRDGNRWCVYRSATDQWLTVPDTGSVIGEEWRMYQIGIGPTWEHALLHSSHHDHFKLLHMFTREITAVSRVPKLGPEKRALNSDREKVLMKNCDGELHCFIESTMRVEKKVKIVKPKTKKASSGWMDNLRGMYGEAPTERTEIQTVYGVYAYRLDLAKKHWKFVCVITESATEIFKTECVQQMDESIYVVALYANKIDIWIYIPKERSIKHVSSFSGDLPGTALLKSANILSTDKYVIIHNQKESKVALYDKAEKEWSQKKSFTIPHQPVPGTLVAKAVRTVISQCEGRSYHLDMTLTAQNPFKSYNLFSQTMKPLRPVPLLKDQISHMEMKRIPTATLDKLTPVTMLEHCQERLLNFLQVENAVSEYRSRMKAERGDDDDDDDDDESDEEEEEEDDNCSCGCYRCYREEESCDDDLPIPPWFTTQVMMGFMEQAGVKERFVNFMREMTGM